MKERKKPARIVVSKLLRKLSKESGMRKRMKNKEGYSWERKRREKGRESVSDWGKEKWVWTEQRWNFIKKSWALNGFHSISTGFLHFDFRKRTRYLHSFHPLRSQTQRQGQIVRFRNQVERTWK